MDTTTRLLKVIYPSNDGRNKVEEEEYNMGRDIDQQASKANNYSRQISKLRSESGSNVDSNRVYSNSSSNSDSGSSCFCVTIEDKMVSSKSIDFLLVSMWSCISFREFRYVGNKTATEDKLKNLLGLRVVKLELIIRVKKFFKKEEHKNKKRKKINVRAYILQVLKKEKTKKYG
ncbi:hypothetical protein V1478_018869 [Vespula squamosa]|uniref:Uncharacterized protein n=1 Tax=Vespula squamosa TaxID=30214 RepID=A0ABD1ZU13_VESSQ